jgi:hypothetical protein
VRVATAENDTLARYDAEGFEHILVWADQLWPTDGNHDDKHHAFTTAARALGVEPA